MSSIQLDEALEVLDRTPRTLHALLAGISPAWAEARENDNTWCPRDIVIHLLHGDETDWMPRVGTILEHGETRVFVPFVREGGREGWAGRPLDELVATFALVRARNLHSLRELRLSPAALERRGRHPELGSVTLGQLLATWTVHDLAHLAQIARALACRYREAVGPWNHPDYLRILQRR